MSTKKILLIVASFPIIFIIFCFILGFALCGDCSTEEPEIRSYDLGETAKSSQEWLTLWPGATGEDDYDGVRTYSYKRRISWAALSETHAAPQRGMVFIVVEASVINMQSRGIKISYDDFTLHDSEGYAYRSFEYEGKEPFQKITLDAGLTYSGLVVFEAPETAIGFDIHYTLRGSPPVATVWSLPW